MRNFVLALFICQCFTAFGQGKDLRCFIFGHSLIDHRPPINATPSDETTVPHWIYLLAESSDNSFAAGGQYGFLTQHADLPPRSQWGYDIVPGVWDEDIESFEQANINTFMITAANFVQYLGPDQPYEDPNNVDQVSPFSATEEIVDWLGSNAENARIYLYENWPDMAGILGDASFPPNAEGLLAYNEATLGDFHNWWIEYQDLLLTSRPDANVRMIPTGPVIAEVINNFLQNIESTELYEDDAPHGRANVYFLAGLVSYMSIYEEKASADLEIPDLISTSIKDQFQEIIDFIWNYLIEFNNDEGISRVFVNEVSSYSRIVETTLDVYPNPSSNVINISNPAAVKSVSISNLHGQCVLKASDLPQGQIDISLLHPGIYYLVLDFDDSETRRITKLIKQ